MNGTLVLTVTDPAPISAGGLGLLVHDTTVRLSAIGGGTVAAFHDGPHR